MASTSRKKCSEDDSGFPRSDCITGRVSGPRSAHCGLPVGDVLSAAPHPRERMSKRTYVRNKKKRTPVSGFQQQKWESGTAVAFQARVRGPRSCRRFEKNDPEDPQNTGRSTDISGIPKRDLCSSFSAGNRYSSYGLTYESRCCTQSHRLRRFTHILWEF